MRRQLVDIVPSGSQQVAIEANRGPGGSELTSRGSPNHNCRGGPDTNLG